MLQTSTEVFFRKARFWDGEGRDAPPAVLPRHAVPAVPAVPAQVVRKNFLLVYELLDEVVDYGFPQNSSTERLKRFIMMEPMAVKHMRLPVRRAGAGGGSVGGGVCFRNCRLAGGAACGLPPPARLLAD